MTRGRARLQFEQVGVPRHRVFHVEPDVGDGERRDDGDHFEVASAFPGEDLARHDSGEGEEEGRVDDPASERQMSTETNTPTRRAHSVGQAGERQARNGRRPVQFGSPSARNPATTAAR